MTTVAVHGNELVLFFWSSPPSPKKTSGLQVERGLLSNQEETRSALIILPLLNLRYSFLLDFNIKYTSIYMYTPLEGEIPS